MCACNLLFFACDAVMCRRDICCTIRPIVACKVFGNCLILGSWGCVCVCVCVCERSPVFYLE